MTEIFVLISNSISERPWAMRATFSLAMKSMFTFWWGICLHEIHLLDGGTPFDGCFAAGLGVCGLIPVDGVSARSQEGCFRPRPWPQSRNGRVLHDFTDFQPFNLNLRNYHLSSCMLDCSNGSQTVTYLPGPVPMQISPLRFGLRLILHKKVYFGASVMPPKVTDQISRSRFVD